MNKKVLTLVGMCGSGKSSASAILEDFKIPGIYFGRLTLEELKKRNLTINEKNEKKIREELREKKGMDAFAKLSLPKIKELFKKNSLIYIDGLYSFEEYEYLKKNLKEKIILVEIYLDKNLRYERLSKRKVRPLNLKECEKRDFREIKILNKGGPIALTDFKIENNAGVSELKKKLQKLIKII